MSKPTVDNFLRARAGDAPPLAALGKERVEASRVCHDAISAQEAALDSCIENSLNCTWSMRYVVVFVFEVFPTVTMPSRRA